MNARAQFVGWGLLLLTAAGGVGMWVAASAVTSRPTPSIGTVALESPVEEFRRLVESRGKLLFRSDDGRWGGHDNDADLYFQPAGKLTVLEYLDDIDRFDGTYTISSDGEIVMSGPDLPRDWPVMELGRDGRSLLLRPKPTPMSAVFASKRTYPWPFRPPVENQGTP